MPRKLVIPLLAVGLAFGACGDSEEDFRDDYRPLDRQVGRLDDDMRKSLARVRTRSDLQLEKEFGQFAQRAGGLQQQVDELEPPEDAKGEQEDLTEALGNVQSSLDDLERAANKRDTTAARAAAVQLVSSTSQMQTARRELARAAGL